MVTARPATSRTSSFAADIGSDYRGSPPLEDPAGVATPPEPDEGNQPDQRNGGITRQSPGAGDSSNQRASPRLIAMWASGPVGPAPCQCCSFGSILTASPTPIRWAAAPRV